MTYKMEASESSAASPASNNPWEELSSIPFAQSESVMGMSDSAEAYNKAVEFTSSNTKEYWKNRANENYDLLKTKNPDLAHVYKNIISENGRLATIKLASENIKSNACFRYCSKQEDQFVPEVAFNLDNIETYTEPGMEQVLKQFSIQLGARYSDIKNNHKLVSAFVFLHEFGHGADFIENYMNPNENSNKPLSKVLTEAGQKNRQHRLKDEMTRPVPGHIKFSSAKEKRQEEQKKLYGRLRAFGIDTSTDDDTLQKRINLARTISYREMSSESIADSFARDYITKHKDEYFLPTGAEDDGSGRIKTGEKILMDDEEVFLSGIRDGRNITLTKTASSRESKTPVGSTVTGFVCGQFELGKNLELVKEDIADQNRLRIPDIQSIERQLLPDGKNRFILNVSSGSTFEITPNPNIRPKPILSSVEEMNAALNLGAGSETVLMKRDIIGGGSSDVVIGKTIVGELQNTPKHGAGITLRGPNGGSTTPIEEVRHAWRTWLFRTSSGSIYEIMPGL